MGNSTIFGAFVVAGALIRIVIKGFLKHPWLALSVLVVSCAIGFGLSPITIYYLGLSDASIQIQGGVYMFWGIFGQAITERLYAARMALNLGALKIESDKK